MSIDWLTARPIAHRGLHDESRGVIENSIAAARAAIAGGYAIECDVQATKDGQLVVFHDDELDRLTSGKGLVRAHDFADVTRLVLRGASEPAPSLDAFLAAVDGATPLVVEIKSHFDGDMNAARRTVETLAAYKGRCVVETFDPEIIAFLRDYAAALGAAHLQLGIVGEARYDSDYWKHLSETQRRDMTHFLHYPRTRPDFLSWHVGDLPHAIPALLRDGLRLPVTTWTVRSTAQAEYARRWTDQIVFEGFTP